MDYVDLHQPKPRSIHQDVWPLDDDALEAMNRLGMNAADFIEQRYTHGGYHVLKLERLSGRRTVSVDLKELWSQVEANGKEAGSCVA